MLQAHVGFAAIRSFHNQFSGSVAGDGIMGFAEYFLYQSVSACHMAASA
jgi:hypothetical protein